MLAPLRGRKSVVGNGDSPVPELYVNKQEVQYLLTPCWKA